MGHGFPRLAGTADAGIADRQPVRVRVAAVEVNITRVRPRIAIAQEITPGSCLDDVVMAHELEHFEIESGVLALFRQQLSERLAALPAADAMVMTDSASAGQEALTDVFLDVLRHEAARMRTDLRAAQAAIDTPETYRAVALACPDDPLLRQ